MKFVVSTLGPDGYERRVQDIAGLTLAVLESPAVYHDETALLPGGPTIYLLPFSEGGRGLGATMRTAGLRLFL